MIETGRLTLRGWIESDKAPFRAMRNDPLVMEYLGQPSSSVEIDDVIVRQNALLADLGYCFWVVERKADGAFLGFCGLKPGAPPIEGRIEIGWSLAAAYWGKGYAREAAEASLAWGWTNLDADGIWAITTIGNTRSRSLMERLGMRRRPDLDFDHPQPGLEAQLIPHVAYRIGRP